MSQQMVELAESITAMAYQMSQVSQQAMLAAPNPDAAMAVSNHASHIQMALQTIESLRANTHALAAYMSSIPSVIVPASPGMVSQSYATTSMP
jgi:hypothetical protein